MVIFIIMFMDYIIQLSVGIIRLNKNILRNFFTYEMLN